MSADRKPRTYRRRTIIGGQFAPRLVEMLESPAWRVLSLAGHRVLDRLDIEHRHHGGRENGRLMVTFNDFVKYGMDRHTVAPALREVEALQFIEITQRGRGGNAEHRTPHKFRITSQPTEHADPTHEWRRIATIEDAKRIARQARNGSRPKHFPSGGKRTVSVGKTPTENGKSPVGETPTTGPVGETPTTFDISGGATYFVTRSRWLAARDGDTGTAYGTVRRWDGEKLKPP